MWSSGLVHRRHYHYRVVIVIIIIVMTNTLHPLVVIMHSITLHLYAHCMRSKTICASCTSSTCRAPKEKAQRALLPNRFCATMACERVSSRASCASCRRQLRSMSRRSPHLIEPRERIKIDGKPISRHATAAPTATLSRSQATAAAMQGEFHAVLLGVPLALLAACRHAATPFLLSLPDCHGILRILARSGVCMCSLCLVCLTQFAGRCGHHRGWYWRAL
jgi:hypothetical protein